LRQSASWQSERRGCAGQTQSWRASAAGLEWGVRPAFLVRQVAAQCEDGILRVTNPRSASLRPSGDWAGRLKAPAYNLFWGDLEADAQRRTRSWLARPHLVTRFAEAPRPRASQRAPARSSPPRRGRTSDQGRGQGSVWRGQRLGRSGRDGPPGQRGDRPKIRSAPGPGVAAAAQFQVHFGDREPIVGSPQDIKTPLSGLG